MIETLRIEKLIEVLSGRWDAFVRDSSDGWFWSSSAWISYCLSYNQKAVDHSFAVMDGDRIVGICPLIQEGDRFSMGNDPCAWPIMSDAAVADLIRIKIHEIAFNNKISSCRFRGSPLAENPQGDIFVDRGKDISWTSQVIDLQQPLDAIWKGIKDGHRAEIHRGLRELNIYQCVFSDEVRIFHDLHTKANGRETRPSETWQLNMDWIKEGRADLFLAHRDNKPVGGAIFFIYKGGVYFASAAWPEEHVAHAVMWVAIRHYRAAGMKALEIGWLNTGSLAVFKKSFGGEAKPVYVTEATWPR